MTDKTHENKVRRWAGRLGYQMHRSRAKTIHLDNHGEYMLVWIERNTVALGDRFNATLDDIEAYLANEERTLASSRQKAA